MKLEDGPRNLLTEYLEQFAPLIGDRRTGRTFRATVQGIIGAESLVAARIAAFSPVTAEVASRAGVEQNREYDEVRWAA